MFHWKIIIVLIVLQIMSFFFNLYFKKKDKEIDSDIGVEEEKSICITNDMKDFIMHWIKYAQNMFSYSQAIIKQNSDVKKYYNDLINTKDNLIRLFSKLNKKYSSQFDNLINDQIDIKTDLCNAVLQNNQAEIKVYSDELINNTKELADLFSEIKKDKANELKLKETMNSHTDKYIKSMKLVKKIDNDELGRELVLGSIDTAKLLFI